MSQEDIKILHRIDEIATDNSEYGYRLIHAQLKEDGYSIGKNRGLKDNGIQISMNGRGRSIDNIVIERFFRTLKHSNIYISNYETIKNL